MKYTIQDFSILCNMEKQQLLAEFQINIILIKINTLFIIYYY